MYLYTVHYSLIGKDEIHGCPGSPYHHMNVVAADAEDANDFVKATMIERCENETFGLVGTPFEYNAGGIIITETTVHKAEIDGITFDSAHVAGYADIETIEEAELQRGSTE